LKKLDSRFSNMEQAYRVWTDKMCKVISETGQQLQGIAFVTTKG